MSRTILVAVESTRMRQAVAFALRNDGYDVIEAADGADALRRINDRPRVAMILAGINPASVNGAALIRSVRAVPSCKATPVIMIVTDSQASTKREWGQAGATGWIVEPFTPAQLTALVRKAMR